MLPICLYLIRLLLAFTSSQNTKLNQITFVCKDVDSDFSVQLVFLIHEFRTSNSYLNFVWFWPAAV